MQNIQTTLFSFLRDKLGILTNAILCYSEIIVEELQRQNTYNPLLLSDIKKIQVCGRRLLNFNKIIFNLAEFEPENTENSNYENTIYLELVTPVGAIIGYCEMLIEDGNAELIPNLTLINRAARQLLLLVDDILSLTQKEFLTTIQSATDINRALNQLKSVPTNLPKFGTILVVDDNKTDCDIVLQQLEQQGYTVTYATNCQSAFLMLKAISYNLILLNITIPGMNAFDILQILKKYSQWRHIPVIVILDSNESQSINQYIELGAEDYLYKPFNIKLLQVRVDTYINKHKFEQLTEANTFNNSQPVQMLQVGIDEVQKQRVVKSIAKTDHFRELQKRMIKCSEISPPSCNLTSTSKIISIHSYRGGTGKSNLIANLAVSLASTGLRVGIVDVDIESPGIHTLFGLEEKTIKWTLNDYLWECCGICEAAYDVSHKLEFQLDNPNHTQGKLYLIPSSVKTNNITRILREGYNEQRLVDGFNQLIHNLQLDYLFIDTHPGINEETLRALTVCNLLIVLLRPDYQDYQGTAIILELARILGVSQLQLVVNKTLPMLELEVFQQQIEAAYSVSVAGIIPLCEEMMHLASSDIFCLHYPNHPLSQIVYSISKEIIARNRG